MKAIGGLVGAPLKLLGFGSKRREPADVLEDLRARPDVWDEQTFGRRESKL